MILQEWTIFYQRRCPRKILAVNRGKKINFTSKNSVGILTQVIQEEKFQ